MGEKTACVERVCSRYYVKCLEVDALSGLSGCFSHTCHVPGKGGER